MASVILDNSLLQVLTTVRRLDLLRSHAPLWISRSVRREHAKRAPDPAEAYLRDRIEDGDVQVIDPRVAGDADVLRRRYRALSFPDAECLAWAAREGAFLLSEDRRLLESAEGEGVDGIDLTAVLLAARESGLLTQGGLRTLVHAIELDAAHSFTEAAKALLLSGE